MQRMASPNYVVSSSPRDYFETLKKKGTLNSDLLENTVEPFAEAKKSPTSARRAGGPSKKSEASTRPTTKKKASKKGQEEFDAQMDLLEQMIKERALKHCERYASEDLVRKSILKRARPSIDLSYRQRIKFGGNLVPAYRRIGTAEQPPAKQDPPKITKDQLVAQAKDTKSPPSVRGPKFSEKQLKYSWGNPSEINPPTS